jgi:hypothetical protein
MTKSNSERSSLLPTRRQVLVAGAAAGAALLLPRAAHAAHNFPCDLKSGFVMDPTKKQAFGYVTEFSGLGLSAALARDLTVHSAWSNSAPPTYAAAAGSQLKVVGVLENFSWAGGVGDPISFSWYMSQENAQTLKTLQKASLKTLSISALGFWLASYDQDTKVWFEQAYPVSPPRLTAQVNAPTPKDIRLHVADTAVKVPPNVDVYQVTLEVVPTANHRLSVAPSPKAKVAKNWGLVVGTLAK